MLVFRVITYVFKKLDRVLALVILAVASGDLAQNALRQGLIVSRRSPLFLALPIPGAIGAAALPSFAWAPLTAGRRRLAAASSAAPLQEDT
ncbi:MAG TPA: hypothetical protein VEL75_09395 [Candidatus Methylomirabilis sp.]|nr:hypothetical protein [Candidatus Methylomirabilis sp.]